MLPTSGNAHTGPTVHHANTRATGSISVVGDGALTMARFCCNNRLSSIRTYLRSSSSSLGRRSRQRQNFDSGTQFPESRKPFH
jgi:hypothetical protein